jgi:hypothetical protein
VFDRSSGAVEEGRRRSYVLGKALPNGLRLPDIIDDLCEMSHTANLPWSHEPSGGVHSEDLRGVYWEKLNADIRMIIEDRSIDNFGRWAFRIARSLRPGE